MNWKEEAAEKLRSYEPMRAALENIPREIRRLEEEYTTVGSKMFTGRPGNPETRGQEDRLMNNIIRRQELQWSLGQAQQWMQSVSAALGVLEPEEKGILHQLYICPRNGGLDRLCQRLQVEKSSIYRRRDKALKKFAIALYGGTETN